MIFKMDIDKSDILIDLEKNEADNIGRLTFLIPKESQSGVNIFFHFLHWFRVEFLVGEKKSCQRSF